MNKQIVCFNLELILCVRRNRFDDITVCCQQDLTPANEVTHCFPVFQDMMCVYRENVIKEWIPQVALSLSV